MVVTPALFWLQGVARSARRTRARGRTPSTRQGTVIIAGMGRFGQVVNRIVSGLGPPDGGARQPPGDGRADARARDQGLLRRRDRARSCSRRRASPTRRRWCSRSTIPRRPCGWRATSRRHHPQVRIIARARDRHHVYQLLRRGRDGQRARGLRGAVRGRPAHARGARPRRTTRSTRCGGRSFDQRRRMLAELADALGAGRPDRAERRLSREGARAVRGDRGGGAQRAGARRGGRRRAGADARPSVDRPASFAGARIDAPRHRRCNAASTGPNIRLLVVCFGRTRAHAELQEDPGRQPRRDRHPGDAGGERDGQADGRGLRRGGQAQPAPLQGGRGLSDRRGAGAGGGLSVDPGDHPRGEDVRRRRDPSGLRAAVARTPTSSTPAPRPGSPSSGRRPRRCGCSATRRARGRWRSRRACR